MHADNLYCHQCFDMHAPPAASGLPDLIPPHTPNSLVGGPPQTFVPTDPLGHSPNYLNFPPISGTFPSGPPGTEPVGGWYPPPSDFPGPLGGTGGDFQYDNNNVNDPIMKKRRGRKKRKVETFAAMNGYLEAAGGYPPGMDGQGGPGKTKRARTSFKHHQLRIMKHHFNINQNPDSRELKILSQKTGLDKKVLQVKKLKELISSTRCPNNHDFFRFGSKMHVPNGGGRGHKKVIATLVLPPDPQVPMEATREVTMVVIYSAHPLLIARGP